MTVWGLFVILAVAIVVAAVYINRQHRHDIAGPDFHDPKGDNWRDVLGPGAGGGA